MKALLNSIGVSWGLLLLIIIASGESDESVTADLAAEALQVTTDAAKAYAFQLAGDEPCELMFRPESVLRWSNPVAGEVYGNVFVWTRDGRPEVIGSLHQWLSPLTHGSHEFHSLATGPVRGSRDGQVVWNAVQPGIELRPVPDQQPVAQSEVGRLRQMRDISRRFTIQKTDREEVTREMRLLSQPIYRYPRLRFSNPVVGEFYAHLFVWTNNGRPEAVASIQKWYMPNEILHVELQSLAARPITVDYRQETIWHPEEAGTTFAAIPGAPAPAKVAPARLREMRQLAREFHTRIKAVNRGGDIDEELRQLAQPIYRYASDESSVHDGAIFAFVRGTDPELLLIIEAHRSTDASIWIYAFAPMNSFEFHAFHRECEVWQKPQRAPPWTNIMDPTKSYLLIANFDKRFVVEENSK